MPEDTTKVTDEEALRFHAKGRPGKVALQPTKSLMTQRDLSLAYSPGVAAPCKEIAKNPADAYKYTAKGNTVAVVSNGTAVLGLGRLGALASKPVMEGKAVLFKRFADIDGVDIEVDTTDIDAFVNCVKYLGPSWGGINLEDIAGPECFIIEQRLKEEMDIPVFHDDQHGTAIITAAGLINACDLTGRKFEKLKIVVNGAGAAGIACVELVKSMGVKHDNVIMCDRSGVIYKGREEKMDQWKSAHAADTKARTLEEAIKGADVFLGLSVADALSPEMVKSMAKKPIIFAMANPDPEILPEVAREVRPDAIIATGRSDYPNQINNVMGFPYIFRGALDVQASTINEEMKVACAQALADLARQEVPAEVASAYSGRRMEYGPEYIIPVPFDPRLIHTIPTAVAKAAMETGVARKPLASMAEYQTQLKARLDPTVNILNLIFNQVKARPQRMIFAEAEEARVIRAAAHWQANGYGKALLVGREDKVKAAMARMGIKEHPDLEIVNAAKTDKNDQYVEYMYARLQRRGFLKRDVTRMVKNDRNIFAACMLAHGDGDAMVTGITRSYNVSLDNIRQAITPARGHSLFGLSILVAKGRTVFISDTTVNELPTPECLADIAIQTADKARAMGHEPRVALLSFSNFGNPMWERAQRVREAVRILDEREVDFEYEGEMAPDVALDPDLMALYPFCRLSGPANVLIMPALHTANISSKLLQQLGGGTLIGPVLMGLSQPAQIATMNATVSEILNLAGMAAADAIRMQDAGLVSGGHVEAA